MSQATEQFFVVIPARKGSKGLPGKHLLPLCGKPLISHTFDIARTLFPANNVFVTTDDDGVFLLAQQYGFHTARRPESLAQDHTSTEDVMLHAFEVTQTTLPFYALLQATSPLRTREDIIGSIRQFTEGNKWRSLLSVTDAGHHPYKAFVEDSPGVIRPLHKIKDLSTPRDLLPRCYQQNGAIYLGDISEFKRGPGFFLEPCSFFLMPRNRSVDIDTRDDFDWAEFLLRRTLVRVS